MSNEPEQIADLLSDDSFLNYCFRRNEADVSLWEEWIKHHPEKNTLLQDARRMAFILNISVSPEEKQSRWERVQKRLTPIKEADCAEILPGNYPSGSLPGKRAFIYLVPVVLFGLISLVFFWLKPASQDKKNTRDKINYTTYQATPGTRNRITLSDGSRVLLNSNSHLQVPDNYNHSSRELILEGDAFFEVAHDPSRPFIVMASGTTTTATGTSFRVCAYADAPTASIALVTGRVTVTTPDPGHPSKLVLYPGRKIVMNKEEKTETQMGFDTNEVLNWVNGILVFNNDTPADIARKLQDWYGMKVTLQSMPIKRSIHFKGEFKDKALVDVLDAISYVTNLRYRRDDQKVILTEN